MKSPFPGVVILTVLLPVASLAQTARPRAAVVTGWGSASGEVTDAGGRPVNGAELFAHELGVAENLILPWAMSDSRGRFHFKRLRWGSYLITGGDPGAGYPPGEFGELYGTSHAPVIVLSATRTRAHVLVRLGPRAALLLLKIVNAKTGKTLPATGPQSPGMTWVSLNPTRRSLSGTLGPGSSLFIPSARKVTVSIWATGFATWQTRVRLPPGRKLRLTVRLRPLAPGR